MLLLALFGKQHNQANSRGIPGRRYTFLYEITKNPAEKASFGIQTAMNEGCA
jgi:hypothetical protein